MNIIPDSFKVALLMMIKNEEKRITVTLDSVKEHIKTFVIYDTGSTDKTLEIIKKYCDDNKIDLRLKEGTFVDFSTSRNISLDFADSFSDIDYVLLLDCNDELRGGKELLEEIKLIRDNYKKNPESKLHTAFMMFQEWWSGVTTKFSNVRLVKTRSDWRYKGIVHEYMFNETTKEQCSFHISDKITIYQDRTKDDNKSFIRFTKDRELLLKEHEKNPEDPRTTFYLAQTCGCLFLYEEAYKYYQERVKQIGFYEEVFQSHLRLGEISETLKKPWEESLGHYTKSLEVIPRAEPLLKIAGYYRSIEKWYLSYMFCFEACKLSYPTQCLLFVDRDVYDYKRYHLMGICAYYCGLSNSFLEGECLKIGKEAALKAYSLKNHDEDKKNIEWYVKKEVENKLKTDTENEMKKLLDSRSTKQQAENNLLESQQQQAENNLLEKKMAELKIKYPRMRPNQIKKLSAKILEKTSKKQ